MSAAPVRTRVSVVPPHMELRQELARLAGLTGLGVALPAAAFAIVGGSAIAAGVTALGVGVLLGSVAWVRSIAPHDDVPLTATPSGIELGEERIARDEVESAAIVGGGPRAGSTRVELVLRRGRTLRLDLRSRLEARTVLDVLRLGARSRTMTRALDSRFRGVLRTLTFAVLLPSAAFVVLLLVLALARGHEAPPFLAELGTLVCLALGAGVLSTVPTRVTIGADAIVERWLGWSRTTRLDTIVRTEVLPRATGLCLHVPRERRILWIGGGEALRRREITRLLERIESARIGSQPATPSAFRDWVDRHASLDAAAWIDALRRDGDGYRETAAVPFADDELSSVLEDPRAEPTERAAAAIALAARVAEPERERIRAVAESTAVEELAEVLERAAADDDAHLAQSIDRLRARAPIAGKS